MMRKTMNPGSIHVRVSTVQGMMDEATRLGQVIVVANLLRRIRTYASVFMTTEEKQVYETMPGLSEDNRAEWQVMEDLASKEEYLLAILRERADYLLKGQHEKGDASGLDDVEEDQAEGVLA